MTQEKGYEKYKMDELLQTSCLRTLYPNSLEYVKIKKYKNKIVM